MYSDEQLQVIKNISDNTISISNCAGILFRDLLYDVLENPSVTTLNLYNCVLSSDLANKLVHVLINKPSITSLNFNLMHISYDEAKILAEALKNHLTINSLTFKDIMININAVRELVEALKKNTLITDFEIDGKVYFPHIEIPRENILEEVKKLCDFYVKRNQLTEFLNPENKNGYAKTVHRLIYKTGVLLTKDQGTTLKNVIQKFSQLARTVDFENFHLSLNKAGCTITDLLYIRGIYSVKGKCTILQKADGTIEGSHLSDLTLELFEDIIYLSIYNWLREAQSQPEEINEDFLVPKYFPGYEPGGENPLLGIEEGLIDVGPDDWWPFG